MRESIFKSGLRALFVTFFGFVGIFIAFLFVAIFFATANETSKEIERTYKVEIVANAQGVRKHQSATAPVILKVNINGVIGSEFLNMNTINDMLIESREGTLKGDRVKGILLSINSPGGTVVDADGIYNLLRAYKEQYKVPIYAIVDNGMCLSGGMYVAVAADKIYSSDTSLIGSIGVIIGPFMNVVQLLEKIGVEALILSDGKGKDNLGPFHTWEPGEKKNFQDLVASFYNNFVNVVASERPQLTKDQLIKDYGARVFTAQKAYEIGLIDGTGFNYRSALKALLKEMGIEDDFYQVVELQKKKWYMELFKSESPLLTGKVKHQISIAGEDLDSSISNQFLYLYRPTN